MKGKKKLMLNKVTIEVISKNLEAMKGGIASGCGVTTTSLMTVTYIYYGSCFWCGNGKK